MNESYRNWQDVGDDPDSLMQTREVWGGGMEEIDLADWNVAVWDGEKPVFAFHKTLPRITFDPNRFTAEQVQDFVDQALQEMKNDERRKNKPKGFG